MINYLRQISFDPTMPDDAFPLVIEFIDQRKKIVHEIIVVSPDAVEIPALEPIFGPVTVRIKYPNGAVEYAEPK